MKKGIYNWQHRQRIIDFLGSYEKMANFLKENNYPFFDKGMYNLNFVLVRNMINPIPNSYNDVLFIGYKNKVNAEIVDNFTVTSVPGTHWLVNPMNPTGAGAIAPGYYRSLWKLGVFRGTDALIQINKVKAYRDNDRDRIYEFDDSTIMEWGPEAGFFLHQSFAGEDPDEVNKSSAGCIVPKTLVSYKKIIDLVKNQKKFIGSDVVSFCLTHLY